MVIYMKNVILIFSGLFFGMLSLGVIMTIYGDMNRSMELQSNFPSIIEEVLEQEMQQRAYENHEVNRFVEDFAKKLAVSWENHSDMSIDVMQYKPEQGILSLRITANYTKPFGAIGAVECERTVIFERSKE